MTDPTTTPTPPQGLTDAQLLGLVTATSNYEMCGVLAIDRANHYGINGSELIAFARAAIAAHEAASPRLPSNFIDPEHTGKDRELLEAFYLACQAEGGTADEIVLRGIRAAIAADRANHFRDTTKMALTPEEVEARFRAWWAESYPNAPVGSHAVRLHVDFALYLLGGEVQ